MSASLPFSQACENNQEFILEVLRNHLKTPATVLEIGGGTGQHAVHFASHLPWLNWQSTDLARNIGDLNQRIVQANLTNLPPATALDVTQADWQAGSHGIHIFTANTLHIMSSDSVRAFFAGVRQGAYAGKHGVCLWSFQIW